MKQPFFSLARLGMSRRPAPGAKRGARAEDQQQQEPAGTEKEEQQAADGDGSGTDEENPDAGAEEGDGEGEEEEEATPAAKAAKAALARAETILTSPEAAGRERLAFRLAFRTDMSAAKAVSMLKDTPKASEGGRLDQAMREQGSRGIGPGGGSAPKGAAAVDHGAVYARMNRGGRS